MIENNLHGEKEDLDIYNYEFTRYFSDNYKKIASYIFKYLKNYSVSEEIAQDVFLKFYKNLNKLGKDRLERWLYRVAHNDTMNYLKKNTLTTSSLESQLVEPYTLETPQKLVVEKAEKELIYNLMMKLPKNQRTALLLKEVKDYSYEKIAKEMGLSYEAIKSLIFRGRQNLMSYYREVNEDEV